MRAKREFLTDRRGFLGGSLAALVSGGVTATAVADGDPLSWTRVMGRPWSKPAVLDEASRSHPRLFLNAARVSEIKRKIGSSHREVWQLVRENADAHLGKLPSTKFDSESEMRSAGRGIPWQALAWLISGEPKYLDGAKKWMLQICGYPAWENNRSLAAGECLFGVALGYDWLHGHLTQPEKKLIREKLTQQAELLAKGPVHRDVWLANHNHVEHLGLAAAGFALYPEVEQSLGWIRQADLVFQAALEMSSEDGSSTEGHQYWAYTAESILRYAELARSLLGENFYTSPWLKSVADFIIHSTLPDFSAKNCVMSYGDSHRTYESHGPPHILYRVASEYRNPYAQWLALEMQRRGVGRTAFTGWADLLWYDETLAPKSISELPAWWSCADAGWVTGRSGWDANATMAGFKCSPMHGHNAQLYYDTHREWAHSIGGGHGHPDVNSFQVYSHGKWLAIDPQYERPKWTHNHNTILGNGKGQLGEGDTWFDRDAVLSAHASSRIETVQHTDDFDYVAGNAGNIYSAASGVTGFVRHFLFLRPHFVVIVDELSAREATRFDWIMQAEESIEQRSTKACVVRNGDVSMDVTFLAPDGIEVTVSGPKLTARTVPLRNCTIVAVLHPRRSAEPAVVAGLVSLEQSRLRVALGAGSGQKNVEFGLTHRKVKLV